MVSDVLNTFIKVNMPEKLDKITGTLVDILLNTNPELYGGYIVYENGKEALYVKIIKAIYGMLESTILWYKKF